MGLPGFTAEASLYRSGTIYAASVAHRAAPGGAVVPAFMPGAETQARCNTCLEVCAEDLGYCSAGAVAALAACIFPPACPAAVASAGAIQVGCDTASLACAARCEAMKCCPKLCGSPDPFNPGAGCCDAGEGCVDADDPNARQGCCPSGQAVCGGRCCAPGESCCGDTCCPPGSACAQGTCCPAPMYVCGGSCCPPFSKCCNGQCCGPYQQCHPTTGACWTPSRPIGDRICRGGWTYCPGVGCCPPGKVCCNGGCYEPYECVH